MKNPHKERLYRSMKQYHRHHQWQLENGLLIPHVYSNQKEITWWDDVGFILNGRRIMVWWIHPRMEYADTIEYLAWQETGDPPLHGSNLFELSKKQWKKIGRSRKEVTSYQMHPVPDAVLAYYDKFNSIQMRMEADGIDLVVQPSLSVKIFPWGRSIHLCVPIEVRDKNDLRELAILARRLIKGETTLTSEFPDYQYGRQDWLLEADLRGKDRELNVEGH